MLLVGRTTMKALKAGSTAQALELPLSIVNHFDTPLRLGVILDSIAETVRLVSDVGKTDGREALLSRTISEEDYPRSVRQVTALLTFVTLLARQLVGSKYGLLQVEAVVDGLMYLGGLLPKALREGSDIEQHISMAIQAALQLLTAERFLAVIASLLEDEHAQVSILLDERLDCSCSANRKPSWSWKCSSGDCP